MKKRDTAVMLGDLLLEAGFVSADELAKSLPLARSTGMPVGRILAESGALGGSELRASVVAQSLLSDNMLHQGLAVKALVLVKRRGITLESALSELGWRSEHYQRTNQFADLLTTAGVVNEDELAHAFEVCFASGMPLGRVLVLRQVLPEFIAYAALTAQVLVRERRLTRDQAIDVVREAAARNRAQPSLPLIDGKQGAEKVRLGELLLGCGVVTEIDLVSAVERAIVQEQPIGQILVGVGLISPKLLQFALEVQKRVNNGTIDLAEGIKLLRNPPDDNSVESNELRPATSDRSVDMMDLPELLRAAGLPRETELPKIVREVLRQKENMAFRMISQQEELKTRLARELHDTIIADLMMLNRYLSGDKILSPQETINIVDDVIRQLRDICYDFAPRQLQDLGLKASLVELLERVQRRAGIVCTLVYGDEPNLPEPVKLHIFRIIQESLNNVEKYANASEVVLKCERSEAAIVFTLTDNGKGFQIGAQQARSAEGGMGLGSMQERAELIRCYFPAHLAITSQPGAGSAVTLEITTEPSHSR